jgi:hypothetical protein
MEANALEAYLAEHGERLGLYRGPDFLALPLPPRSSILGPWLIEQSLTMLYAERGLGKSLLMLGMALAVAKGEGFLGFPAGPASSVLYVDGEMPPRELQQRLGQLAPSGVPDNLFTLSATHAGEAWADLSDPYGRFQLLEIIREVQPKVLVLDNKSTLIPPSRENDADSWVELQKWFINLRQMGLAVVLVHHSGKNGLQRGTSLTEVVLDTIIKLQKPPPTDKPADGARFVLTYEKNRHFYGQDAQPMLVELTTAANQATWQALPYVGPSIEKVEQAKALQGQGLSQRAIAEQMGVALGTINSWLKAA